MTEIIDKPPTPGLVRMAALPDRLIVVVPEQGDPYSTRPPTVVKVFGLRHTSTVCRIVVFVSVAAMVIVLPASFTVMVTLAPWTSVAPMVSRMNSGSTARLSRLFTSSYVAPMPVWTPPVKSGATASCAASVKSERAALVSPETALVIVKIDHPDRQAAEIAMSPADARVFADLCEGTLHQFPHAGLENLILGLRAGADKIEGVP